jgi:hypothetical protein
MIKTDIKKSKPQIFRDRDSNYLFFFPSHTMCTHYFLAVLISPFQCMHTFLHFEEGAQCYWVN